MDLTTASEAPSSASPAPGASPALETLPNAPRHTGRAVTFLLLIACAATAPGWLPGRVYVPTDCLQLFAPWGDPDAPASRPGNELLLDQPTQFVPWTLYAAERLRHFELPLWNPYAGLGQPLLGNGQSAVFYPTMLLHVLLRPTWSWTLSAALRLWIAGCGMWMLAGRYGLRGAPRLLSALAFMLCGFNIVWLNHPHFNTIALLPWGILVVHRLIDRTTLGRVIVGALLFALQFLGGHPASCIHFVLTCGLVFAAHLFWLDPWRALKALPALALALGLGFSLAGVQWLPLLDYVGQSAASASRSAAAHGQPFFAMKPGYLVGILFPYANGYPPDRVAPLEFSLATHLPNTSEIAAAWVGTIPLLLAGLGAIFNRRKKAVRLWLLVGGVAAAIAIQLPGVSQIVNHVPGLRVSQNGRLLVTTALALAILAGFGLESLMELMRTGSEMPRLTAWLKRAAIGLTATALLGALVLFAARKPMVEHMDRTVHRQNVDHLNDHQDYHALPFYYTWVRRFQTEMIVTALRLSIPAVMLAMAWLLLQRHRRRRNSAAARSAWPWVALALLDLLIFAIPYNQGAAAATFFNQPPSLIWLQQQRDANPDAPFRLGGTYHTFHPETSTVYHLADVRGYDAITPIRYWDWMHQVDRLDADAPAEVKQLFYTDMPALRLLGMRYLMSASGSPVPAGNWQQVFPATQPAPGGPATAPSASAAAAPTAGHAAAIAPPRAAPAATHAAAIAPPRAALAATRAAPRAPARIAGDTAGVPADATPAAAGPSTRAVSSAATQPTTNVAAVLPPASDRTLAVVYENPDALPRAWMASAAIGLATHAEAIQRVLKYDFDPRELVVADREIPPDDLEWMTRPASAITAPDAPPPDPNKFFEVRARPSIGKLKPVPPKITWVEDSPERVRLHIDNSRGGWLVLADTYMNGWHAKLGNPAWGRAHDLERLIVPAYGVLRAIQLGENSGPSVDVTFEYDPPAFRRGLLLSGGAASALVLLFVCSLLGRRRTADTDSEPTADPSTHR